MQVSPRSYSPEQFSLLLVLHDNAECSRTLSEAPPLTLILPSDPSSERPSPGVWEPLQAVKPDGQVHRKLVMAAATL